jgi:hypothetical protein
MIFMASSVGTATRYWLDGQGIKILWGRGFPLQSRPALRSTRPLVQCNRTSFPGVKRSERGVDRPPYSKAEVKATVELYFYYPSGLSFKFYFEF